MNCILLNVLMQSIKLGFSLHRFFQRSFVKLIRTAMHPSIQHTVLSVPLVIV